MSIKTGAPLLHLSVTWLPWAWHTNREMVRAKAQEGDREPSSSSLRLEGFLSALPLYIQLGVSDSVTPTSLHFPQQRQLEKTRFCPAKPPALKEELKKSETLFAWIKQEDVLMHSKTLFPGSPHICQVKMTYFKTLNMDVWINGCTAIGTETMGNVEIVVFFNLLISNSTLFQTK